MPSPSDEDLLLAVRTGDHESLGVLVSRWEQPLYRFAYRMLARPEDARDVCQETFLRVLSKADRFQEGARFSTWMYQIALNLCRDHLRKERRWGLLVSTPREPRNDEAPAIERFPATDDPSEDALRHERRDAMARALEEIPRDQREVVMLKEYEGLKFREIAEILDCPESTVKSRMYYGLNGLKSALERRGIHGP